MASRQRNLPPAEPTSLHTTSIVRTLYYYALYQSIFTVSLLTYLYRLVLYPHRRYNPCPRFTYISFLRNYCSSCFLLTTDILVAYLPPKLYLVYLCLLCP